MSDEPPKPETKASDTHPLIEKVGKYIGVALAVVGFLAVVQNAAIWTYNRFQVDVDVLVDARQPSTPPDMTSALREVASTLRNYTPPPESKEFAGGRQHDEGLEVEKLANLEAVKRLDGYYSELSSLGRVRVVVKNAAGAEQKDLRFRLANARAYWRTWVTADGMSEKEIAGAEDLKSEASEPNNKLIDIPRLPSGSTITYDVYCDPGSVKLSLVSPESTRVRVQETKNAWPTNEPSVWITLLPLLVTLITAFFGYLMGRSYVRAWMKENPTTRDTLD